jgi:hypothetical protein
LSVALGLGSASNTCPSSRRNLIAEKRQRIEERLWAIHEANIQDLFEVAERAKTNKDGNIETDENGRMLTVREDRPRFSALAAR